MGSILMATVFLRLDRLISKRIFLFPYWIWLILNVFQLDPGQAYNLSGQWFYFIFRAPL